MPSSRRSKKLTAITLFTLLPTVITAQWGSYLSSFFGSSTGVQGPTKQEKSLAKTFVNIDSTNWQEKIQKSTSDQWFIYFTDKDIGVTETTASNVTSVASLINTGFQESVHNLTKSALRPKPSVSWVNCKSEEPTIIDLCEAFLAVHLPQLYHVYRNTSLNLETGETATALELRRLYLASLDGKNVTNLVEVVQDEKWKKKAAWTGIFNPVDGQLKEFSKHWCKFLYAWGLVPNWILGLVISFIGQRLTAGLFRKREPKVVPVKKAESEKSYADNGSDSQGSDVRAPSGQRYSSILPPAPDAPPSSKGSGRVRRSKTPASGY